MYSGRKRCKGVFGGKVERSETKQGGELKEDGPECQMRSRSLRGAGVYKAAIIRDEVAYIPPQHPSALISQQRAPRQHHIHLPAAKDLINKQPMRRHLSLSNTCPPYGSAQPSPSLTEDKTVPFSSGKADGRLVH